MRVRPLQAELATVLTVTVNCMTVRSSHAIFPLLASTMRVVGGTSNLQHFLTAAGPPV